VLCCGLSLEGDDERMSEIARKLLAVCYISWRDWPPRLTNNFRDRYVSCLDLLFGPLEALSCYFRDAMDCQILLGATLTNRGDFLRRSRGDCGDYTSAPRSGGPLAEDILMQPPRKPPSQVYVDYISPLFPSSSLPLLLHFTAILSMALRVVFSPLRPMAYSHQRLAQVSRHFSSTGPAKQEIQDAYIISASRTPTAKVSILRSHLGSHILTGCSSMALSSLFQPPNLARSPSSLRSKSRRSPLRKLPMYTWEMFYKVELARLQLGKL
jgi:hypothetical protein